jgi:hypothetical protein
MVAIVNEVFVRGFRYFGVTVIGRARFPNLFDIVENGMNFGYPAHTAALAVWQEEVDVAADATKRILQVFEGGFGVGVVAGIEYEVGDRFDERKEVGMPFKKRGKPDLHHVFVLWTGQLFHAGKFVSKLAYVREAKNYGKLFIYQVQTLFLAINIFQKTNNPFPGVIFKQALQ